MDNPQYKLGRLLEETADYAKGAAAMRRLLHTAKFKKFLDTAEMMVGPTVSTYAYSSSTSVYLVITINSLEGFKDSRLAGILETWEYLNPDKVETSDYPTGHQREFMHRWGFLDTANGVTINVNVSVCANIKTDSETCKRVVTGVKTVEQISYKFVCDEDQPAPTSFPVDQIADVSADLDELTRAKAEPLPIEPVATPDLGKWENS